jgi:hypothetical protein
VHIGARGFGIDAADHQVHCVARVDRSPKVKLPSKWLWNGSPLETMVKIEPADQYSSLVQPDIRRAEWLAYAIRGRNCVMVDYRYVQTMRMTPYLQSMVEIGKTVEDDASVATDTDYDNFELVVVPGRFIVMDQLHWASAPFM